MDYSDTLTFFYQPNKTDLFSTVKHSVDTRYQLKYINDQYITHANY